ncbi:MAG: hypothetical protein ABI898_02295 [Sphingomonadales bacterium]
MDRIDPDTLATHLEVALTCTPPDTLMDLQDMDGRRRRKATAILARHLAERLGCFEFIFEGGARTPVGQGALFPE